MTDRKLLKISTSKKDFLICLFSLLHNVHKAIKNEIFRYIIEELSESRPHLLLISLHMLGA